MLSQQTLLSPRNVCAHTSVWRRGISLLLLLSLPILGCWFTTAPAVQETPAPVVQQHKQHSQKSKHHSQKKKTLVKKKTPQKSVTPAVHQANAHASKKLVDFVDQTVYNLNYSSYQLGGAHFDTHRGVYIIDCSRFVDRLLSKTYPRAYLRLVNATGADFPASQHYYDFFSDLSGGNKQTYWNRVDKIKQLQPGDILVFRYKNLHGRKTSGHVMVVMKKPVRASEHAFFVRVADSAPIRHSEDTRARHESGIGIGTLLLKLNPHTGKPTAYAWQKGGSWKHNVVFAMARPLKVSV